MRAVAEELGTGAGSLYWHVRGKEELLNLMVDRVIGALEVPDPDPRWQEQVKELARVMQADEGHRDLAEAHPPAGSARPNAVDANERILAILREGGVPDRTAAWVVDLMSLRRCLRVRGEPGARVTDGRGCRARRVVEMIGEYFRSLPPDRFPNTFAVLPMSC